MIDLQSASFASWVSMGTAVVSFIFLRLQIVPAAILNRVEGAIRSLANRLFIWLFLLPAVSFSLNVLIAVKNGIPRPRVQDEFSYLLAADTFSAGRITNPTPAFWEHFETPHELMRPTYMSKYPPGQGLILAIGQTCFDLPIVGVWMVTALACVAIYWMLLGFVSKCWAWIGGLLCVFHPLLIHWSQIYWGGSLSVLGGAMVIGAWARLMKQSSHLSVIVLTLGIVVLANSRPFEGLVLIAPLLLPLFWHRRKNLLLLVSLCSVLVPAVILMGYDNYRVTGHPLRLPYQQYIQEYDVYPKFWFESLRPLPVYYDDMMRSIHTIYERGDYDRVRMRGGLIRVALNRFCLSVAAYTTRWVLLLPLGFSLLCVRQNKLSWIWISAAVFSLGLLAEKTFLPHYTAPFTAGFILLMVIGLQYLLHRGDSGRMLCMAILLGFTSGAAISIAAPPDADSKRIGQLELVEGTEALQSGHHLVFVNYTPDHLLDDEWVYNRADIFNSRIIWARYLGDKADRPMIQYFGDRTIWLLTVGQTDLQLVRYPK